MRYTGCLPCILVQFTGSFCYILSDVFRSNISKLCAFLGPQRTSDVLLSHMLTYFNNKGDWRLRAVFFDSIVGVATYCGSKSTVFPRYSSD